MVQHMAPKTAAEKLEPIVQDYLGDSFPACSAYAVHRGRVVLDSAWGWIDPEAKRIPVKTDTLFDLASVTKLFTTTAFLTLVSQGQVKLDDPLVTVVPEFGAISPRPIEGGHDPHSKERLPVDPAYAGQVVDPARVTFRHLLTHTSGLPPWRDVYNAAGDAPVPPDQPNPTPRSVRWARGLKALCGYPFVGQPDGLTVRYSDIGLLLLGEATARLYAQIAESADQPPDLLAAVQALVLNRLPHADALMYNPVRDHAIARERIAPTEDDPTWRKRRVWGEVHDENACGVGGVAGHAGLFGTAAAVAALGQAWLEGGGRFGIAPEVWREATREQVDFQGIRRGLGFALKVIENAMAGDRMSMKAFGHSGFTGTTLWIDPERELVVALLTNRVYPGRWHEGAHGGVLGFRRAAHDAIVEACES